VKDILLISLLSLAVILPVLWLLSEFQSRRWLRILAGVAAIGLSFFLSAAFGGMYRMSYNSEYGASAAELVDVTIAEMEAGRQQELLAELKSFRERFEPTYEKHPDFNALIDELVTQLKNKNAQNR